MKTVYDSQLYSDLRKSLEAPATGPNVPALAIAGVLAISTIWKTLEMSAAAKDCGGYELLYDCADEEFLPDFVARLGQPDTKKIVVIDELERAGAKYLDAVHALITTSSVAGKPVTNLSAVWVVGEELPEALADVVHEMVDYLGHTDSTRARQKAQPVA